MIKLTDADMANITQAWANYVADHPQHAWSPLPSANGVRETFYRAGLAAGIERAAKAAKESWQNGYRGEVDAGFYWVIRALLTDA
jgi:hypothetical protein